MEVDEDAIMGGLNGTESNSLQSTEPNGETATVDPTILGPTSLKDAAPSATDPAISPSPPRVGSRTLPGVAQDEIMDDESTNSSSSDEEDGSSTENLSHKPTQVVEVVINVPAEPHIPYASSRTGLVYDAQMRFHAELNSDEDDIHPEDPRRIWEIYNELVKAGLVDDDQITAEYSSKPFKLWRIPVRLAEAAEVALVHKPELYNWVASLRGKFIL
jgi:histone deacetylase 6